MTVGFDQLTIDKFNAEVRHQFTQQFDDWQNFAYVKQTKNTKTETFPIYGSAIAYKRNTKYDEMPVTHTQVTSKTVGLDKYTVMDLSDWFDQGSLPYDEIKELTTVFLKALNRRLVQVVLDALAAGGISKAVAANFGAGGNTNLTYEKLLQAAFLLEDSSVDVSDSCFIAPVSGKYSLLKDDRFISNRYVKKTGAVETGAISTDLVGFGQNMFVSSKMQEGGLPTVTGSVKQGYAYNKNALALAVNMAPTIRVMPDARTASDAVVGYMYVGCEVLQEEAFVRVLTDTSV
jgi:hypothetical protein